jgi:hypothetical protein
MVKINIKVKVYVKLQLSHCLIEENGMKVNGQVDEQRFVFSASSRDIGEANGCRSPLNRKLVGSQSLWGTEKSHIPCQIRRKYPLLQAVAQGLTLFVVKLWQ